MCVYVCVRGREREVTLMNNTRWGMINYIKKNIDALLHEYFHRLISDQVLSTTNFPIQPYWHMTSSNKNLHAKVVMLFLRTHPSTWFVNSSLASSKYFIFPIISSLANSKYFVGIAAISTIHLQCIASVKNRWWFLWSGREVMCVCVRVKREEKRKTLDR